MQILARAASDIRCFLRWLHLTERTVHDLSSTVIAPPVYAFEGIPSAVGAEDVKKIMAVTQKDCTPKGIRDYAILMLLSTYGVRAGEITMLRLDDVDWRNEIIRIRHNKTGATSYLPLLPEVGEAILQYLQKSRPKTAFREVFIRCCAPYRPFKDGSNLGRLVRRWFEDGCYPGEPVFVQRPNGADRLEGVIVSVVLDGQRGRSFLLVLDAQGFEEVGRAFAPHVIPFGFHGEFKS